MTRSEARRALDVFRNRWPDAQQLRLTIEEPADENDWTYVLRLFLPQQKRQMRMFYLQQLDAALDKIAGVLGEGVVKPPKKRERALPQKPAVRRGRQPKATTHQPQPTPPVPSGPPVAWAHGDLCELRGRHDGPFTVLAVVDPQTLLCRRLNGSLFHGAASMAIRVVGG